MSEETLFAEALARQGPARAAFLDEHCKDQDELRQRLEALLRAHDHPDPFLEKAIPVGATVEEPALERAGTVIGPYKLLEQIGEGGFGVVFMAEQLEPVRRKVALKILKPGMDTRQVIARFEAERQALAIMDHPNIAKVHDGGATPPSPPSQGGAWRGGRPYFVMELVKGVPITEFCDQNHLTPRQRLELFLPICQAVQHAHHKGIIHRDLKPSNVLVSRHDSTAVPKIIDFGIAKALGQELTDKTLFTGIAQMVGTPLYMSPEQAGMSDLDVDTRSDIYSLGVLLYELLTGTTPFDRERFKKAAYDEIRRIIREEDPPKPSTRLSDSKESLPSISAQRQTEPAKLTKLVRGELDWIVMKALEKDRNRRYETANGFAMDVQRYLADEPVQACPPSVGYRLRKFVRRNRPQVAVAGLVLLFLVVLAGVIGYTASERSARQALLTAQVELILDEAERLEREQKWPEALAAVQRAEAALAAGEPPASLRATVQQMIADLELVERLEDIHLLTSEVNERGFDYASANRHYAAAFRQHGIDVDLTTSNEAAEWFRSRPAVLPALITALDEWAAARGEIKEKARAKALTELAHQLDGDPWRGRLRKAWATRDYQTLEALAGAQEVADLGPHGARRLAWALTRTGKPERALEILDRALREHPDGFWLHFHAAEANGSCRPPRNEAVVRHYTAALALRPRSSAVLHNLGNALLRQERLDEAIASYRKATELAPKYAGHHFNLGTALWKQRKFDEAIASYRKAIELEPNHGGAHLGLGNALSGQARLDEAVAAYSKAIELDPRQANAHYNLGIALKKQGKLHQAIASFRQAIEVNSKHANAHLHLGLALKAKGLLGAAIAWIGKGTLGMSPSFAYFRNLDEAIACLRTASELQPNEPRHHYHLGKALHDKQQFDDAIVAYRKATELDPNHANTHNLLGNALNQQAKFREAIPFYRRAAELSPKSVVYQRNLARMLIKVGDHREGIKEYRRVVELDPKDAASLNSLAWHLARLSDGKRNPGEAVDLARRAVKLEPTWSQWNTLMVAALGAGNWEEALRAADEAARRKDVGSARCWNGLGMAMARWQLGQKEEARTAFDRVAEESKKYSWLRSFRQEAAELLGITPAASNANKDEQ